MLKSLKTSLIASAVPWGIGYSLGYQTLSSHKGTYRSELSTEDGGQRAGPGHGTSKGVFQSVLNWCLQQTVQLSEWTQWKRNLSKHQGGGAAMGYGFLFTYFSPRQPYKTHQELGAMEAIRTMPNSSAPKSSSAPKRKVSWVTPVLPLVWFPPLSSEDQKTLRRSSLTTRSSSWQQGGREKRANTQTSKPQWS